MKSKGIWFLLTGILIGIILVLLFVLFNGRWNMNNMNHMWGDNSTFEQMDDNMMGNDVMTGNGGPMGHGTTQAIEASDEPEQSLPIPSPLKPDRVTDSTVYYTVVADEGTSRFFQNGKSTETLGYNGNLLGPMLELPKGKTVVIDTINRLDEPTTFHWHGLVIPAEMDGGPHQAVAAGDRAQVRLDIDQEPSTLWFHPHPMGATAEQVYKGLAGLLYVTDDAQSGLPNDYGVDDIPLIVQDRLFTKDGELDYDAHMNVDGTTGDTILANGAINTTFDVQTETLRVRLVNGSNARDFDFTLSNGENMTQIAADGGLLEQPVSLKTISLTPGERAEVLIDFSEIEDDVALEADGVSFTTFRVGELDKTSIDIPTSKKTLTPVNTKTDRQLTLFGMGNMVSINGDTYDPDRIDIKVKQGDTEIWEIENKPDMMGGMTHPFHIHGVQFRIISRDGNPPADYEKGWKDTVAVAPDERVKIELTFTETGTFMYHCHILEHEENGMMGQLNVTE
ncbi:MULTISPECIES: multicopper oxidase domain-containing protein [unclassified Exiguobacterium]|uniref:multicopper oxidase family protein n=1 Tax=unclassified Exiguobacterium TaxID=2644629 RepID=UPI0020369E9A|nr:MULTISPECIES: multicopper oxidase domain-containing protein [unclassified Exiguobacterium]